MSCLFFYLSIIIIIIINTVDLYVLLEICYNPNKL